MDERRKHERKRTDKYIPIYDCLTDKQIGTLADITVQGVGIICNVPLETGTVHQLRMELPEKINDTNTIEFHARVTWCGAEIANNIYRIGFIFDKITEADIYSIIKLLDSPIFEESMQRKIMK